MNIVNKKDDLRSLFSVFILGFIVELLFYVDVMINNALINYFAVFLFLCSFVFLKRDQYIYFIFLLIPNQRLLVLGDSTTSILNLGFFFIFIVFLLKNRLGVFPRSFFPQLLVLIFYGIIISVINNSFNELLIIIKLLLVGVALFIEFHNADFQKTKNAIICFIVGIFIMSIISLTLGSSTSTERFQGGELNEPNYIGTICSFGLAVLLVISKKINVKKLIVIIVTGVIILVGLLTQSRSFVLSLSLIISVYFILNLKNRFFSTIIIISCSAIFLMGYLISFYESNPILQAINSRIINPRGDDVSGGRLELWDIYYNLIVSNDKSILFGMGSDAMQKFNLEQVAHNAFLEDFVTFGFVGVLLIYTFLYFIYKKIKYKNASLFLLLPLIIFLLNSMTLHSFLGMGGLVQLFIGLLVINFSNLERS